MPNSGSHPIVEEEFELEKNICHICRNESKITIMCVTCGRYFCISCGIFSEGKCVECIMRDENLTFNRERWISVNHCNLL